MIPLEFRDQGGHSETSKNGWVRCVQNKTKLHTKLVPETVH